MFRKLLASAAIASTFVAATAQAAEISTHVLDISQRAGYVSLLQTGGE